MTEYQTKSYPRLNWEKLESFALDANSPKARMLALAQPGPCVEFGCGTGSFTQLLQAQGYVVTGVEVNPEMAEAAAQFCERILVADLNLTAPDDLLPAQTFDYIFFGDVLEHLIQPGKTLAQCRPLLRPDGAVIASIPNIAHGAVRLALLQGKFNYTRFGILDDTHLRFFTPETVLALFEEAGYRVTHLDRTYLPVDQRSSLLPQFEKDKTAKRLLKAMRQDKDCNTLQVIIKAVPRDIKEPSGPESPLTDISFESFARFVENRQQSERKWYRKLFKSN